MANKSTFIKIDRNIIEWRWYKKPNTFRLFIHLLIKANIESHYFEDILIERGQLVTSYDKLAAALDLTSQQIRTSLSHLKSTGEITSKIYPKFQVISILNYDYYQGNITGKITPKLTGNQQANNRQITGNQQANNNNIRTYKEHIKNDKEVEEVGNGDDGDEREDKLQKFKYGIMLSENQVENLLNKMQSTEVFDYYLEKLGNFIKGGGKVKNHYQTMLKWYNEDTKVV